MKKKLVTVMALSSILLLAACSNTGTTAAPTNVPPGEVASSSSAPTSPVARTTSKPTKSPEEHDAIDVKFEVTNASKESPYGIDYASFGKQFIAGDNVSFTAKEVEEATRAGMETYYKLRTDPRLFKNDRTSETDDKVIKSHAKGIGKLVLDDWEEEVKNKQLFDYVPGWPSTAYVEAVENNKFSEYYIDTSKLQKLTLKNASVEAVRLEEGNKPALALYFTEVAELELDNDSKGTETSTVELYMEKDSKGTWKLQGTLWDKKKQILVDSEGKALPQ